WYTQVDHPDLAAITTLLDNLSDWPDLAKLEFLISKGTDPIAHLQVGLNRQIFALGSKGIKPSKIQDTFETQRIYMFSRHGTD
ncbi:MAG: bifunctional 3,4-dihydroxy-2-butanone-4-phosphate synthase/GTP cyclohydrolase II, partial [Cyanobacteria bacterium]|nr:bifunctional 3,4-dihydroxy-2-butanone-4-phosphate synthase/GTP cyclohydrolase II [Cyanobacteriota bacterium]